MFSNLSSSLVKCTAQRLNYIMYIYNRRLSVNTNSFPFPLFFHYLAIPLEIHLIKALVTVPPTNLLNICIFHFLSFESILQTVTMWQGRCEGWHIHSPFTHSCIFTPSYNHIALASLQLICTQTSIFHSCAHTHVHTHTHTHTHILFSTPGSRRKEPGSVPRSPRSKYSQMSSRHRAGWWAERTRGAAFPHRHPFPEKGRSSQYRAAPGQKGIRSPWLTKQATVRGRSALSWDISHAWFHLASCPSYNM